MGVKDKVLLAAEELFSEKGYENTSIQDIIDKAEVSKGGLYHHFESKEKILDALLQDFAIKMRKNFEAVIKNEKNLTLQLAFSKYGKSKEQLPEHLQDLYLRFLFNPREILIREKFLHYIREEIVIPMTEIINKLTDEQYPKEFAYILIGLTEIQTRLPLQLLKDKDFTINYGKLLQDTLGRLIT